MKMKLFRKTAQHKWSTEIKVLQINSANKVSDSDFYIKKADEPLKLSFPNEKKKFCTGKKFTLIIYTFLHSVHYIQNVYT